MDQTEGVEVLQQDACWVDEGQARQYERWMDVALYKDSDLLRTRSIRTNQKLRSPFVMGAVGCMFV